MTKRSFRSAVEVGHGDVHAVIVPFHPADAWPDLASVKLALDEDPRGGRGWPVHGTIAGQRFAGHVGHRYGRSYVVLPPALLGSASIGAGDEIELTLAPREVEPPVSALRRPASARRGR